MPRAPSQATGDGEPGGPGGPVLLHCEKRCAVWKFVDDLLESTWMLQKFLSLPHPVQKLLSHGRSII